MESSDTVGELRKSYTYMPHDVIEEYDEKAKRDLVQMIEKGMPRIEASHSRANLMTLPAEICNRISEMVVVADDRFCGPDGTKMMLIEASDRNDSEPSDDDFTFEQIKEEASEHKGTQEWITQPALNRVSR